MQDLLKDHLVEHVQGDGKSFSLTCTVCGAVWKSETADGKDDLAVMAEAKKYNRMCPFCGRPVCLHCFEDVEGIVLCTQCGQRLRRRMDAE